MGRRVPLGSDRTIERLCTRWVGGSFGGEDEVGCGKHAVAHIFWLGYGSLENSFACLEHVKDTTRESIWKAHPMGPDCGMPGSLFFPDENVCRCDGQLEPAEETEARKELVG